MPATMRCSGSCSAIAFSTLDAYEKQQPKLLQLSLTGIMTTRCCGQAVREQALALLGHATALGDAGSAEWDGSRAAWQAFLRLYETLQQFAVHLTTDVWPGIVSLFEAGEELRGPRPSHPALQVNEWAAVLFRRGLASENHAVQKLVLFSILEGDLYGHRHARVTDDVIFGSEASVLHTSLGLWLYRQVTDDDDDSEVALLLREFFSRHLEAIAAPEGGEGAAAAFLLRLVEYLHSIPDTVTSRARMTLIGILEHLRLPSSGAALIGDRGLRELRGIIVDQLPMEHSEGARRKILEAVLSATCRFAAPVDGQQTDCVSFGAVARMLVHYPVELLAGQAASTVLSSFVQRLGSEWLVEGMSSLVSDYIEAGEGGQRMETAPSQLAVMLALAVHFDDAAVLCQQVLAPAVDALQTAWRHVYAPAGRAEAAIELLDAVLKPPRSRVVDDCLVPLIAAGADDIAAYLRACIERLLAPLTPGSPRIEGTGGARANLRATAAQYAQFTVRCCSLLCESGEADRFAAVAVAAADLAAGAVAAHPERDTLGGTARNLARMDALATLVVVMPSGHRGAGTPAELARLLTASASVELEAQDSDVRYSAGDRYGESWSERRNLFCRWKWDCVCVLVSQLSPFGAEPSDGQVAFPADDSAGLATALIAVVEGSADALDMLTPGQGAAAASNMLLPIFDMLKEVLPWYVTRGDGHTRQQCHERLERVVEPAWTAFAEVDKKTLPFLLSAIALFLPASLWDDEGWHLQVDGSKQPSPFKRMYARLAEMGASNRSTRVMSTLSLHCCRLWTKHPHTASLYLDELVAICCYTNAHDESSKAHQHSATLLHIDAKYCPACVVEYPTVFIARDAEETARQAARLFAQFLCTSATAEHAADVDAEGLHYGLAVSLLRKLMGRNELPVYASPAYAPGSDVWKLKIVLWQAICVLVACVRPESGFALEVHTAVAAMIKRNEAPTVRQYADAAAVQLVSRCPELLETPGWIQGTLRDFKSAPQVAMSLCVVVVALAPRLTAPARSRYFHELFTPMVTWVSAGNRPLRALAMVAVARLIDLAEEARRAHAADNPDADVDACGWPDLAHDEYCPWLQAYLRGSPEGRTFTQQLGPFLDAFQPEELCSPITTASRPDDAPSSAEEHLRTLRQFPTSVYELIKDSFKGSMSLVFADEDSETTWQPGALDPALPDYVLRYQEELKKSEASAKGEAPGSEGPAVADEAAPEIAFQRKITPNVPDESADDEAAPTPQAAIDLELIVVGSLIEDVPSLGGLARSCEIFNASKLILADRLIPTKPQFISTSVTAGRWVPLSFVAPPDLHDFLGEARRTGSTVVGVTHPAPVGDRTVRTLDAFEFPRRTMLLLGDPRCELSVWLIAVHCSGDSCAQAWPSRVAA